MQGLDGHAFHLPWLRMRHLIHKKTPPAPVIVYDGSIEQEVEPEQASVIHSRVIAAKAKAGNNSWATKASQLDSYQFNFPHNRMRELARKDSAAKAAAAAEATTSTPSISPVVISTPPKRVLPILPAEVVYDGSYEREIEPTSPTGTSTVPDITEEDFELPLSVKDVAAEASAAVPLADKEIVVVEMTPQSSAASLAPYPVANNNLHPAISAIAKIFNLEGCFGGMREERAEPSVTAKMTMQLRAAAAARAAASLDIEATPTTYQRGVCMSREASESGSVHLGRSL